MQIPKPATSGSGGQGKQQQGPLGSPGAVEAVEGGKLGGAETPSTNVPSLHPTRPSPTSAVLLESWAFPPLQGFVVFNSARGPWNQKRPIFSIFLICPWQMTQEDSCKSRVEQVSRGSC